jgi:signal transduction histidine kinase
MVFPVPSEPGAQKVERQGKPDSSFLFNIGGLNSRDTGISMLEKDLKRIFQPFEQGDNSASRKYQGTGLGLSLTKKIIELHNGRLRAESEGIGQGSIFHFILPR